MTEVRTEDQQVKNDRISRSKGYKNWSFQCLTDQLNLGKKAGSTRRAQGEKSKTGLEPKVT